VSAAERLRAEDVATVCAAIVEIAARGTADADEQTALLECLGHARKAVQRPAAEALAALVRRGVPVRDRLAAVLASPAPRARWGAAFALARLDDPPPAMIPVLLETLGGDDGDLRWAAADVLLHLPERDAVVAMLRRHLDSRNPVQRKMSLYLLRDLGDGSPDLEVAATRGLGDADPGVRLAAAACLAQVARDRPAAARHLIVALHGDDARLARATAAALGTLGERSADVLAALRAAAGSTDPSLRRAAERSLATLGAEMP
jgi:HEAT repeat protein